METQKIKVLRHGKLTEDDRISLCTLLCKAGYTVRLGRENVGTQQRPKYENFIEYWEGQK